MVPECIQIIPVCTKSGVTISIADLSVPESKKALLQEAEAEIEKSTNRYLKGEITEVER